MPRPFTTTEEADICCHPSCLNGWVACEEVYAINENGDKLSPVGDNLYEITRAASGAKIQFTSLAGAMERL